MKIWVTKYLFTSGIHEMEAKEPDNDLTRMVVVACGANRDDYFHGNDWHRTREAAVAHAQIMRTRKLASIDKQRKKIADMVIA